MSPAPSIPSTQAEAASLLVSLQEYAAKLSPSDRPNGLLAAIKQTQRLASSSIVHAKAQTAEVRIGMDQKGLDLMGLEYEKRRLVSEINRCEEFDSIYQTVPLQSNPSPSSYPEMIAALNAELASVEQMKANKLSLQRQGDSLARENKEFKGKSLGVEDALKDYGKVGIAIQNKMRDALPASAQ